VRGDCVSGASVSVVMLAVSVALVLLSASSVASMEPPKDLLMVPWYEVDEDPSGPTTLFAVRNVSPSEVAIVLIDYWSVDGVRQWSESIVLFPEDTFTRNVRHVLQHLPRDSHGRARGFIYLQKGLSEPPAPLPRRGLFPDRPVQRLCGGQHPDLG